MRDDGRDPGGLYYIFKAKCRPRHSRGPADLCTISFGLSTVLARDDTIIIIEDLGLAAFERPFTKPFVIFPIGGKKNKFLTVPLAWGCKLFLFLLQL